MIHTFPEFEKRIVARLDTKDARHGKLLYSLMSRCFQNRALTKWMKVADKVALDDRTADIFRVTQQEYLESLAEIKNLGDCLIRQLRDRAKPAPMPFNDYIDRRDEWRRHLNGPYLRHTFAKPNDQEWAEQIFSQQPKTHQARYAEKHEDVETDIDKLKLFFNGCHAKDVSDGTFAKVLKNARDSRRARIARERGETTNSRRERRRLTKTDKEKNYNRYDSYDRPRYDKSKYAGRGHRQDSGSSRYRNSRSDYDNRDYRKTDRKGDRYSRRDKTGDKDTDGQAHQISEERSYKSRSRSRSRSSPRKSSPRRSPSPSGHVSSPMSSDPDSGDMSAYHLQEETPLSKKKKVNAWTNNSSSEPIANTQWSDSPKSTYRRYVDEVSRKKSKFVGDKRVGFGSFFNREKFDYSEQEFHQAQGHKDRVRTADCTEADRQTRRDNDDDSHRVSDWNDRTGIHKVKSPVNQAQHAKQAEEALRQSRAAKEGMKEQTIADKKKADADKKRPASDKKKKTESKKKVAKKA